MWSRMLSDRKKRINLDVYDEDPEELDEMFWEGLWDEVYDDLLWIDDEEEWDEEDHLEDGEGSSRVSEAAPLCRLRMPSSY